MRRWAGNLLLILALGLAVAGLVLLGQITSSANDFGRVYQTILLVNTAGAAVLLLLIGGNLVRLFREFTANEPGSRLKARMVGAITALVIAPMAVVYFYSVQFLNEGVDSWFDVQVEQGLDDALELSRAAIDLRMRDNLTQIRRISDALIGVSDADMFQLSQYAACRHRGK